MPIIEELYGVDKINQCEDVLTKIVGSNSERNNNYS